MGELVGITVVIAGVTSGFGPAVAEALVEAGARVVGVGTAGTGLRTLATALGAGFVPEGEPAGRGGREDLLRTYGPRLLVITGDAAAWVLAGSARVPGIVIMRVSRSAQEDPRVVGIVVGTDAGPDLTRTSPRIADRLRPLLLDVRVGHRVAELAELALMRGEPLAAGYRIGAGPGPRSRTPR